MVRTLFFRMVFRKFLEITKKTQFLVSAISCTIMNISFFSMRFDFFSIIAKEISQIRNTVVCVVARLVFLFCCALTTGRCNVFQHNFENKQNRSFTAHISRLGYFLWPCFIEVKLFFCSNWYCERSEILSYSVATHICWMGTTFTITC